MDPRALVMDVGMFDGSDTTYYLSLGHRVLAIEASPAFVESARTRFRQEIVSGQLMIENVAIGEREGTIAFHPSEEDLGSSSLYRERVALRYPLSAIDVPCKTFASILSQYGTPFYLKVDIEGADRHCILALDILHRPRYVSFEIGDDVLELLKHLRGLGYEDFKIINQVHFRELSYVNSFLDRFRRRLRRFGRRSQLTWVVRHGRKFACGHSSGPMGDATAGRWHSYSATVDRWTNFLRRHGSGRPADWYDLHARLTPTT
jgi:FkbM family methyltransferase